jgi:chemotaxis protein histidine kinase CheA
LIRENENLKLEKQALLLLLKSSTSSECYCRKTCCTKETENKEIPLHDVVIKKEKAELHDDEIEIIEPNKEENIVYEIYEGSTQPDELIYGDDGETIWRKEVNKKLVLVPDMESQNEKSDDEEDGCKNGFECDDCNIKGINCYEDIGLTKYEADIYFDLGEPDRCEKCFNKWKSSDDASDYLKGVEEDGKKTIEETKPINLCENTDCERYPSDWDSEEDTESTYQEGQWKKCCLCDGYFDDDGFGDILYVQEAPNNKEAGCDLCGKNEDIVQMKGSGQYLCGNACDEDSEVEVEEDEEEEVEVEESEEEEVEETEEEEVEETEEEEVEESEEEEEEVEASEEEEEEEEVEESEEEEEEEEEVEEVEESEEEEEVEETEEEEVEESEEEEEEVFEIEINGTLYYTTDEKNGDIYKVLEDEDIGDKVGKFVNKVAKFN